MKLDKKNIKIIMLLITFTVSLVFAFQNIPFFISIILKVLNLLFPFILGLCIAFILNVLVSLIEKKLNKKIKNKKFLRMLSITLSLLTVSLIVIFVLMMAIPDFIKAISSLINTLPDSLKKLDDWLTNYTQNSIIGDKINSINWDSITNNIINFIKNSLDVFLNNSINFIKNFISSIISFVMGIIFSIYILAEKETLAKQVKKVMKVYIPSKINDKIFEILKISNKTFSKFITGQCLEAIILGSLFFIAMSIFRFPYTLAISSLITLTALIPIFGALIASVFGIILIGITSPVKAFWFFILFQVIQQIEGNLIYPKVVGKSVGLPSLFVMLAVMVGGNAFGLIGMLISVPISSILYSLFKTRVNEKLKES